MSRRKYVLYLLTKIEILDCKPIEMNHKLVIYRYQILIDKQRYQCLVEKLIYLSHTIPKITYAISMVIHFMYYPNEEHMDPVYHILRYLKMVSSKGLLFTKHNELEVTGYIDVD